MDRDSITQTVGRIMDKVDAHAIKLGKDHADAEVATWSQSKRDAMQSATAKHNGVKILTANGRWSFVSADIVALISAPLPEDCTPGDIIAAVFDRIESMQLNAWVPLGEPTITSIDPEWITMTAPAPRFTLTLE